MECLRFTILADALAAGSLAAVEWYIDSLGIGIDLIGGIALLSCG